MEDAFTHTEGFEPWIPTYADIIAKYPGYGFPGLEIDAERFPVITQRRAMLETRFYERFASRMINQETLERWQLRLQSRFDEIAPSMERAFRLYDRFREEMESDVLEGHKTVRDSTLNNTGSDTTRNLVKGRRIDTPDSRINEDPDYADSLTETTGDNTITYASGNHAEGTVTFTRTGGMLISNINAGIYDYRDIDTELVKAFENNFLNLFWS